MNGAFFQCLRPFLAVCFQDEDQESYYSVSSLFIHKRDSLTGSGKIRVEIGQQLLIRILVCPTSPCIQNLSWSPSEMY